jgi:hypothetical protein
MAMQETNTAANRLFNITDISAICEKAQKALPLLRYAGKLIPLLNSANGHAVIPEVLDAEVLTDESK